MISKDRAKVIAIFVAYNASKTLKYFYESFPKQLVDDIILVDDASKDNTFELGKELGIKSYRNPINLGYGGNMKRALNLALEEGADIIIDIHPDNEYKPSAIPLALEKIKSGSKFVLGYRFNSIWDLKKNGMYLWKIFPLYILNIVPQILLRLNIRDPHQGFRVYTREFLEKVNFKENSNNYLFSFEIIAQAVYKKIKINEVPIETKYEGDKRGASFKSSASYFLGVLKILLFYLSAKSVYRTKIFR